MFDTGRHYLAIPGPSVIPDRVLNAMHRPAPDVYAGVLPEMVPALYDDLKALVRTRQHLAVYIANGHGAWEAANTNLFSRGDRALALVTGLFGEGWARTAEALGVDVARLDFGRESAIEPGRVEAALRADTERRIRVVLMSHVDTTTSVRNDIAAVRAAIDAAGHPALLAVDGIASIGCDVLEMDLWGIDVLVGASQKGMMTPPGLGFVWFSEKARMACQASSWRTPYWDWGLRNQPDLFYQRFGGTAPTHHLFGLQVSMDMVLREEGLDAVWHRHARLARAVASAFEVWGTDPESGIRLNVAQPHSRSHAVTTVCLPTPHATRLRQWLPQHAGVTLGLGVGMATPEDPAADGFLRIAHMGHVNMHMTLGVLGAIEGGLRALGIAHTPGGIVKAAAVMAG
jgi:alanine-glyoxylate transaminase/serine-glyoxylate transaminase/serine-pyruvate transaminase